MVKFKTYVSIYLTAGFLLISVKNNLSKAMDQLGHETRFLPYLYFSLRNSIFI